MTYVSGVRKIESCTRRLRSTFELPGLSVHLPHAQGETWCLYHPKIKVVMQAHGTLWHPVWQNHGTCSKVVTLEVGEASGHRCYINISTQCILTGMICRVKRLMLRTWCSHFMASRDFCHFRLVLLWASELNSHKQLGVHLPVQFQTKSHVPWAHLAMWKKKRDMWR